MSAETEPLLGDRLKQLSLNQATFNIVNIIMGLGFLAIPFVVRVAGWIVGAASFAVVWFSMNWTAKLVGACLEYKRDGSVEPPKPLRSFPDLADLAFGGVFPRRVIAASFMLELVIAKTAIMIVAADNLDVFLRQPPWVCKVLVALVMWLTTFASIKSLSFSSLFGMLSCAWIVATVVVDGLLTYSAPGSLLHPSPTTLGPDDWSRVFIAPSVFMSCLSGHAVFPSLHLVMRHKSQFASAVNRAFLFVGSLYVIIATCGYLSFGPDTLELITKNLARYTNGDSDTKSDVIKRVITQIALVLMVIIPLTKFALLMEPVASHLVRSVLLPNEAPILITEEQVDAESEWRDVRPPWRSGTLVYDSSLDGPTLTAPAHVYEPSWLRVVVTKTCLALVCLAFALLVPSFVGIVGLMGAALSCSNSILFPCAVYLKLYFPAHEKPLHPLWRKYVTWTVFYTGVVNAVAGTIVAVIEATRH